MQWNGYVKKAERGILLRQSNPVWPTWKHAPCSKSSSFSHRLENSLTAGFHRTISLSGAGITHRGLWQKLTTVAEEGPHTATLHGATVRQSCAVWRCHPQGKTAKEKVDKTINLRCSGLKDEREAGALSEPPYTEKRQETYTHCSGGRFSK